ncbi:MAG TPA: hypothetical protein VFD58_25915 [Blastocatellia bacterium]|nr:hypothetical protein [Blastocatellia bacterium]
MSLEFDVLRDERTGRLRADGNPAGVLEPGMDTTPEVEKLFREMLMARSSEERIRMAASMFDTAREVIPASFPPGLTRAEIKSRLFERLYAEELAKSETLRQFREQIGS